MTSESTRKTVRVVALVAVVTLSVVAMGVAVTGSVAASHDGETIVVDDDWASNTSGDAVGDGHVIGTNASATISDALDLASAGDTILVHEGDYSGFMVQKSVNVTGAEGEQVVVDASLGTATSGRVIGIRDASSDADGASVSDLTVDATGQSSYVVGVSVSADQVTVRNVEVLGDSNVTGIQTQTGYDDDHTEDVVVTESTVENANVGISLQSGNDTATNNVVTGAILEGIGVAGDGNTLTGNDVSTAGSAPGIRFYGPIPTVNGVSGEVTQANELLGTNPNVPTVAFKDSGATYDRSIETVDRGTYYATIQHAVNASSDGDTIELGSIRLTFTLDG